MCRASNQVRRLSLSLEFSGKPVAVSCYLLWPHPRVIESVFLIYFILFNFIYFYLFIEGGGRGEWGGSVKPVVMNLKFLDDICGG